LEKLNTLKKRTNGIASPKKGRSNKHFVFVICILIASFFWLLIKLSDDYSEVYNFKVGYENAPTEKMFTGVIDTNIKITIKAQGFQMLKLVLTEDLTTLNINLNNYQIIHSKGNIYYINTGELKVTLAELTGVPTKQIDISSQRLEFKLENLFEKTVNIVNNVTFNFTPQYNHYNDIIIQPNRISIFGPKNSIDTIESVFTENKIINDISSNINETIKIINPDIEHLQLSVKQVNIKANVEKFTESSIEMAIDLSSLNYNIKAFPNTVKVFFTVAQKDFSIVRQAMFNVKPNIKNIDILKAKKLQLEVVKQPELVSGIRIQPSEIEFLIIK